MEKVKPTSRQLIAIVDDFYEIEGNGAGGCLHIVLDDLNLEKHNIEFCLNYAKERNDEEAINLAKILLLYTEKELKNILVNDGGY